MPPKYETVSVDRGFAQDVRRIYDANPGMWVSKRQLWLDLLRRGRLDLERDLNKRGERRHGAKAATTL